ncbi:MAG: VOC family protein [Planctomycetota bacterium]|jgi:lactoylglutathione lyase
MTKSSLHGFGAILCSAITSICGFFVGYFTALWGCYFAFPLVGLTPASLSEYERGKALILIFAISLAGGIAGAMLAFALAASHFRKQRQRTHPDTQARSPMDQAARPSPNLELDHLVLRCHDLDRSRAFYEALGMAFAREQHGRGPLHFAYHLGTVVLELYPATADASGPIRIGLRVTNVRATLAAATAAGGTVVRDHAHAEAPSAVVRAPDGNEIALTAQTTTEPPPA